MAKRSVFLNLPYDNRFQDLLLGYIVGLTGLRLVPRAALEVPSGQQRIHRIFTLLKECDFSIHDLSWVALDEDPPPAPRYNMPFELGMAYFYSQSGPLSARHQFRIFAAEYRAFEESLSDLKGIDIYQHVSDVRELMSRLTDAFCDLEDAPSAKEMLAVFYLVKDKLPSLLKESNAESMFYARVFKETVLVSEEYWRQRRLD